MDGPLAYLLTWRTYGTWLHGDERGSVDRENNIPNTPLNPADERRLRQSTSRMRSTAVVFNEAERGIVAGAIEEHGRARGWTVHALAVRSNHVHVVVENAGVAPERMIAQFKSWATRRLREAGRSVAAGRVWVDEGSTRYLWKQQSLVDAVRYVEEGQDVPR